MKVVEVTSAEFRADPGRYLKLVDAGTYVRIVANKCQITVMGLADLDKRQPPGDPDQEPGGCR